METYEKAVMDPVAGSLGRIWLEYARFAEERDKMITAQNVYLRALVGNGTSSTPAAVTDEQDSPLLWNEFLEMMRRKKNPSLTLQDLKRAVENEHVRKRALPSSAAEVVTSSTEVMSSTSLEQPEEKRARTEQVSLSSSVASAENPLPPSVSQNAPPPTTKTYVVTAEDVENEKSMLLEMTSQMPSDIWAEWITRDGDAPPTAPEYPLFTPTRPKLSDSSGRDLVGDEMALAVMERLLQDSGTVLLETCRGLWLLTALKEKEAAKAIENLDKTLQSEMKVLESNLDARLSVAGPARGAVEQMNANERKGFEASCSNRRRQLLDKIAWDFRQILCIQQLVLTQMKVPGFDGPTVDSTALEFQSRICSLLHTAFFLRKNLGEDTHKATLKSSAARLKRDSNRSPVPRASTTTSRSPPRSPVRSPVRSPIPGAASLAPPPPQHMPPPLYGDPMVYPQQQQQQQPPLPQPGYPMQPMAYPPMAPQQNHTVQNPNVHMMPPANGYAYPPPSQPYY